jgi:multisubunit Na+/H+ antiporter MnhG subunit
VASILGMAAVIPWERRRWHPVGPLGLFAVTVALVLVLVAIWLEPSPRFEFFYKTMGMACVIGVAFPHIGLLSLARLRREYGRARQATVGAIVLLAGLISYMILAERDDEDWMRAVGILAIVVACGTVAVPVLHRVSAIRAREDVRTVELLLSITCPRCNKPQTLPVGRSKCASCSLKFSIEIEEEHCPSCGYPLYLLTSAVCPECGTPVLNKSS